MDADFNAVDVRFLAHLTFFPTMAPLASVRSMES